FRARAILRLCESALQESTRPTSWGLQSWRAAMEPYVGLDVSLKLTAICIVDRTRTIAREGVVPSDPEAIATFIRPSRLRLGDSGRRYTPFCWCVPDQPCVSAF